MPPYNPILAAFSGSKSAEDSSLFGMLKKNNSKTLQSPPTLEVDYDKNITDLYQAITNSNWEGAIDAALKRPEEARTWVVRHYEDESDPNGHKEIMWRFLPIHSASARQPPRNVISALLRAYPDAAKCVDDQGMYALHYACGNQADQDVIRMLLVAYPEAAALPDPNGMLPLHYLACWGPLQIGIIDIILVANREALTYKDVDGNTPLDLAMDGDFADKNQVVTILKKWESRNNGPVDIISVTEDDVREPEGSLQSHSRGDNEAMPRTVDLVHQDPEPRIAKSASHESAKTGASNRTSGSVLVNRLRDEIASLKIKMTEANEDNKVRQNGLSNDMQMRVESLERKVESQKDELDVTREELDEVQKELESKEEELIKTKALQREAEAKLAETLSERVGLRLTLTDLMEQHEKFKKKSDFMNDRLGSLSASISSMIDHQKTMMKTVKEREESWKSQAKRRREKLKELLECEEEFREDRDLERALDKTKKEMEAIFAVLAVARS